jgi:tetratricopeptide (TPR) repeat protein
MLQLAAIYRERRDWLKARQLIGRAAAAVDDPGQRTRLLVEAAEICAKELDDEPQAAGLYAEALALDDQRKDVVERLADIRFRRGDWAGLLPLATRLIEDRAAFDARPPEERGRLWYQLARAAEETDDETRALEGYRASLEASATGPGALGARRGVAGLSFKREAWADAAAAYEAVLADSSATAGATALKRDETLEALERQGIALLRAGEPARAIDPLERALAMEPRRRRVLEAVVEAGKAAEQDEVVVRHSQVLLNVTEDPTAKRELLEMLATIHRERRNDPQRAIAAYLAALELWPDERSIMHRLLELLSETKQWRQAVQLLARLAELTDADQRAPYYVAAGNILVEELNAGPEAIEAYERALDADPNDLKSFERIDRLVNDARDWKTQERAYRRQIKRMGPEAAHDPARRPALLALWQGLGEIYRSRLKDLPAAIAAFEVATGLDPETADRRRLLAELYRLAGPDAYAKAIAEHRALIQRAASVADMVPDVKMMLRLFVEQGALDEAHACAAVLALSGKADPDERALYEQYRPRGVVRAHGRLTEELWQRLVYHPDEDRALSQLLATLSPAVSLARAKAPKELGLKKKHQHDVLKDPSVICRALAYAVGVLGVPVPDVYLVPESPGELEVANLRRTIPGVPALTPALIVGAKLLATTADLELAFTVGRALAAMRPDHVLRWPSFVPTLAELAIVAQAAVHICDRERPLPADDAQQVAQYAAFLDRTLPPQMVEQLSALVRRSRIGRDTQGGITGIDFGRWARGACLTTIRTGFLLAGDLEGAVRLGQAVATAAGIDSTDVTRDLAAWSVSEGYFELRAQLGLRTVNLGFRG